MIDAVGATLSKLNADGFGIESETQTASEKRGASFANAAGETFADSLRQAFEGVNEDQTKANIAVKELVAGRTKNIHETMLVLEKADISLKMMMQVRNKIVDAYKEIMRMQI